MNVTVEVRRSFRIEDELWDAAKAKAYSEDMMLSQIIRRDLALWIAGMIEINIGDCDHPRTYTRGKLFGRCMICNEVVVEAAEPVKPDSSAGRGRRPKRR